MNEYYKILLRKYEAMLELRQTKKDGSKLEEAYRKTGRIDKDGAKMLIENDLSIYNDRQQVQYIKSLHSLNNEVILETHRVTSNIEFRFDNGVESEELEQFLKFKGSLARIIRTNCELAEEVIRNHTIEYHPSKGYGFINPKLTKQEIWDILDTNVDIQKHGTTRFAALRGLEDCGVFEWFGEPRRPERRQPFLEFFPRGIPKKYLEQDPFTEEYRDTIYDDMKAKGRKKIAEKN